MLAWEARAGELFPIIPLHNVLAPELFNMSVVGNCLQGLTRGAQSAGARISMQGVAYGAAARVRLAAYCDG
jgi:hypothetical protein